MARNTLAVEYTTPAAQVQVYRLNNGSFLALGNPFTPGNGMVTQADQNGHTNLAVEFGGDFYVNVGGDVRKFDPSTGNWIAESLPAVTLDGVYEFTGFFIGWSAAGVPRLCWALRQNGNLAQTMFLDLGGAWALGAVGPVAAANTSQGPGGRAVFRNSFHTNLGGTEFATYDIATDSWTVQVHGQNARIEYVRARGRLFALHIITTFVNGFIDISEFVGGAWTQVFLGASLGQPMLQCSSGGYPAANGIGGSPGFAGFYDATADKIIIVGYEDRGAVGTRGLKVLTFDPDTLAVVDVTATVAPAAIRYNTAAPTTNTDCRVVVQVDNETNPLVHAVTIWIEIDTGQWEGFTYVDPATLMVSIGTGGGREIALAHDVMGGGEFFYEGSTTADPHRSVMEVLARVPIPGGTRMFFTAHVFDETGGAPATSDLTMALYFNVSAEGDKGKPGDLCQIAAAARFSGAGSIPVLNAGKVDSVTPDGTTVYSVDWDAVGGAQVADGIFHQLMPRLEV